MKRQVLFAFVALLASYKASAEIRWHSDDSMVGRAEIIESLSYPMSIDLAVEFKGRKQFIFPLEVLKAQGISTAQAGARIFRNLSNSGQSVDVWLKTKQPRFWNEKAEYEVTSLDSIVVDGVRMKYIDELPGFGRTQRGHLDLIAFGGEYPQDWSGVWTKSNIQDLFEEQGQVKVTGGPGVTYAFSEKVVKRIGFSSLSAFKSAVAKCANEGIFMALEISNENRGVLPVEFTVNKIGTIRLGKNVAECAR